MLFLSSFLRFLFRVSTNDELEEKVGKTFPVPFLLLFVDVALVEERIVLLVRFSVFPVTG